MEKIILAEEFRKVRQGVDIAVISWHTFVFVGGFVALFMMILHGGFIPLVFPVTFLGMFLSGVLISVLATAYKKLSVHYFLSSQAIWRFGSFVLAVGLFGLLALVLIRASIAFDYISWILFGAFSLCSVGSLLVMGKSFERHYATQRPLNHALIFCGLLFFFIGITGGFTVIAAHLEAFSIGMWVLFYILYILIFLGITIGYHRLATHKAFQAGDRNFEKGKFFTRFLLFNAAMSGQREVEDWGPSHKIHHTRTDIEAEDPHTPREGFWWSHNLWLWFPYIYPETIQNIFSGEFARDPRVQDQKRYYDFAHIFGLVIAPFIFGFWGLWLWYTGDFSFRDVVMESFKAFLLVALFRGSLVYNFTFSVNSVAHFWGPQPYKSNITGDSRDVWLMAVFTFGETLQDIHHLLQDRACYWIKWYYFDISGALIIVASWLNRYECLGWMGLPCKLKLMTKEKMEYIRAHTVASYL